jgi:hypothetical protein
MTLESKGTLAAALAGVMLLTAETADAALMNGFSDASFNTSVFISVVERNNTNQVVRNLVIDTGARAADVFAGNYWSTTAAQEAQILAFLGSATGTVGFNVGGALNDQSFATFNFGFLTSGVAAGPGPADYTALGTGVTNIDTFIGNTAGGSFNVNGVLAANAAIDPGWHDLAWRNDIGGAILPSNEIAFGQVSQILGWKTRDPDYEIVRAILGPLNSNPLTGDITFGVASVVPVPAAVWLFGSAVGLLGVVRRRRAA